MSSRQDSAPIVIALKRVLAIVEERSVGTMRRETSYIIFDFDVNQSDLKAEHQGRLDELITFLEDHPGAQIVSIVGRASQTGPEPNNENLAFDRAETARAYLAASGISTSRIGPTLASGSRLPIVDSAGREEAINRSVEIICAWEVELEQVPTLTSSKMSTQWNISLGVTFGAGAVIFAGQVQLGRLTNKSTGESRHVQAFIAGPELAKSVGPVFAASVGTSAFEEGDFETARPVDFDYFDGQPIVLLSIGGAFTVGGSATKVYFPRGTENDPSTRFANIDIGFTLGLGGAFLFGFLNVDDR